MLLIAIIILSQYFKKTSGEFCHYIGKGHLDGPCDLSINVNNLLLVVDRNQYCVSTSTLDDTFVIHWGQINEPSGLITDSNDWIIVAVEDS